MKLSLLKTFVLILISGIILLALIVAGDSGMPEPLPTARLFLGIIFILLVPGYALQSALFPRRADLDTLARLAFSFGLSIAILPPIFLLLSALGLGIQFWVVAIALSLFVLICAAVAILRQRRLPEIEKPGLTLALDVKGWWVSQDRVSHVVYVILAFAFAVAAFSGVAVALEKPGQPFTEFYLLDSQGLAEDYPREVTVDTLVVFNLGIASHEGQTSLYNIVAARAGAQSTALAMAGPISLADGATWQGALTFALPQTGNGEEIDFLLERVGSPWPYRTLRVWMNIVPAGQTTSTETTWVPWIEEKGASFRGKIYPGSDGSLPPILQFGFPPYDGGNSFSTPGPSNRQPAGYDNHFGRSVGAASRGNPL